MYYQSLIYIYIEAKLVVKLFKSEINPKVWQFRRKKLKTWCSKTFLSRDKIHLYSVLNLLWKALTSWIKLIQHYTYWSFVHSVNKSSPLSSTKSASEEANLLVSSQLSPRNCTVVFFVTTNKANFGTVLFSNLFYADLVRKGVRYRRRRLV